MTIKIVVTGADGFIGRNLRTVLRERGYSNVIEITRSSTRSELDSALEKADCVFHLAGINRPDDLEEFVRGNSRLTVDLCESIRRAGRRTTLILASSTQAMLDNPYGRSKLAAEDAVQAFAATTRAPVRIFRLPNVFGKWARRNYNSAVATFCHNISRGIPITVNDTSSPLKLVYIDDVVEAFLSCLPAAAQAEIEHPMASQETFQQVSPVYETTVGTLASIIHSFAESRKDHIIPQVGTGFLRALYSTYVSYLPTDSFSYAVNCHSDPRGVFVEMLKTPDCGQFSYFTAFPGVTRGEHYHHTKTEKFLVIKGSAHFGFRNIISNETHEIVVHGGEGRIVQTVPGWTHNITNIGTEEMVVMLWANEIFDRLKPDTIALKVTE